MTHPTGADLRAARVALTAQGPLVHCITNTVVQTITANALLAVGAAPAMVEAPEEAADFARVASALLVNVGTVHARTEAAMRAATAAAAEVGTPWVLDPVAVGGLRYRTAIATDLLSSRPTVVRGNASEVLALAGAGAGGRGVDSTDTADDAGQAATDLAARTGGVVSVSGPVDLITDGESTVRVGGGSVLLTRTTGAGCALGALVAAYAAVAEPLVAAIVAHAHVALAAERAAAVAAGPGSFAAAWLDALDAVGPDDLAGVELR